MTLCRVIIDPQPMPGAWNMALDEALLDSAVGGGPATVRLYRWESATLSLGYFQGRNGASPISTRFEGLPVVRRLTGGGAIVHDRELTYSCTLPAGHPLASDPRRLYTRVHERMIALLGDLGFAVKIRGTTAPEHKDQFLCFARGDDFDGVMGRFKVLGSAQRRRKGAVLQHGSLILRASAWAPEFPGVFDCGGHSVGTDDLSARLADSIADLLGGASELTDVSANESRRAVDLSRAPQIVETNK